MSESTLRALMQLFALISDIGDANEISVREKDVLRSFLARQLNSELVDRYIKIFEEYLDLFINKEAIRESEENLDIPALKSLRIKRICDGINEELRLKQKIYIIIQLIDFISYGKDITANELDFLITLALALNIPENEYKNIKSFILDPVSRIKEKEKLLLINNDPNIKYRKARHITNSKISGELMFLNIVSTKTFILRYTGDRDLYLDGQQIFPKQTYLFDNGSTIKGQGLNTLYYSEVFGIFNEVKPETKITLTARDLSFRFADSENGIQDFNFHEESGQLVGILGVSGTGKSTLLNLLNGNIKPQSGDIYINGYNLNNQKERENLKGIIGFVPQDDFLIEELTVYQNLYYSARLCLNNFSVDRIKRIVVKLLMDLDLYEIRELKVGSPLDKVISGGQRKRINIALELVREPYILFVDEPTSGLSSVDSEVVINLLKEQTYKGKLVIINIHQPSSDLYKLFDKIIILDKGGYQIYYGNPNAAIVYFKKLSRHANADEDQCAKCGNINTEQLLQIVEAKVINEHGKLTQTRKVAPREWYGHFLRRAGSIRKISQGPKEKLPENFYSLPGIFKQLEIFFIRDILSKLSDRQYLLISFLGAPLLALFLGYFTKYNQGGQYIFAENENLPAYLFMCVITSLFLGLMISAEEILKDRKILKRESFLDLSWFSYINSKAGIMFIISAVNTISFIVAGNLILGIKGMTLPFFIVLFTTSCSANLLGLNISSAFKSVITIYILIPFIIIPQLLFSGVLVKFDKLHRTRHSTFEYVPVIGDLMTTRWAFEAIAVEQFKNNRYERNFFNYDMEESQNNWYASFLIPELKENLRWCNRYRDSTQYKDEVADKLFKVDYYSSRLTNLAGFSFPPELKGSINEMGFNSFADKGIMLYLDSMKSHFVKSMKAAMAGRDSITRILIEKNGEGWLLDLQENYENRKLKELVLDWTPGDKLIEKPGKIIQKYEPAFMKPIASNGRAHFYAPVKKTGSRETDTFLFNVLVIWGVSMLLYIALYFKLLRKIIAFFENFRSKKSDIDRIRFIIEMPG